MLPTGDTPLMSDQLVLTVQPESHGPSARSSYSMLWPDKERQKHRTARLVCIGALALTSMTDSGFHCLLTVN